MRHRLAVAAAALALGSVALWPHPAGALSLSGRFLDDDGNPHEAHIEAIAAEGITRGCGDTRYCPRQPLTRAEMASLLVRALHLPPAATSHFSDLGSTSHAPDIEALGEAGIAQGCAPGRYCPEALVRRDEMASLLARGFGLPPLPTGPFTDVHPASPHLGDVNAIAAAGITRGCGPARYCPADQVRRDHMASFLARALSLPPIPPRLPLSDGLPVTCSKDGLTCNSVVEVPRRAAYGIREGFYTVLPSQGEEEAELASPTTRVELTVDGVAVALAGGDPLVDGSLVRRWFTGQLSLAPGRHVLVARWLWDGELVQTTTVSVTVLA